MTSPSLRPPVLLWACLDIPPAPWLTVFAREMPELEIRVWPDIGDPADITYAFVWKVPPGVLAGLPNLQAVFSLGAGVDRILGADVMPAHLPLVRMVDPGLKEGMGEFVLMQALHYHRAMPAYAAQQARREWRDLEVPLARRRTVGVMGLGQLGRHCAEILARIGFPVRGWARSPHDLPGIATFHGADGLSAFLSGCEILVCLLPLTPDSRGILNAETFARMPHGSHLINVGRGGHLVDADLLAALDSGQIAGATLDVFQVEPLPPEHPFWSHPRIVVTPHVSAPTYPDTAAPTVIDGIRRHRAGQPLLNLVDRAIGY
ncbi:glyoxylate/hydroxypyruvate reductase A [Xanthobacter sp. V4C-4]|uniref:2-hydroxyacid dehydrogenase n=1 Tax=Xanthobacter cornucopiae TaxID=3119924 RepID=UPI00372C49B1